MAFRCIRCRSDLDKTYKACPRCGEPVTEFLRRYLEEPVDGKYEIVERLGAGGMGEVYKVNHVYLHATRVIKVIRPQISESMEAHERFLREARIATRIQHPNVATLHDFSALPDGSHYMVWEYIDGENLAQRIHARGTLAPRYAVRLAIEALHGLDAIHRAGIVHRDISPENIMLAREGSGDERVKVIDLGVAKTDEVTDNATRTGVFIGKLRYASPEHLGFLEEGEKIDGRADLYSLAIVLYEMLAGRPPFEATSPHQYILMHSRESQFRPLDLPPDLAGGERLQAVMRRALERDRNKRFASAREFAAALGEVERSLPDPNAMKTVNLATPAFDADATMRVSDTLHRETLRTPMPKPMTVAAPAPPPVRRAPATEPATPARSGMGMIGLVGGAVVLVLLGVIAYLVMRLMSNADPTMSIASTTTTSAPVVPAASTTMDVVTTTTATPPPPPPVVTTTTAAPAPPPPQPVAQKPAPVVPREKPVQSPKPVEREPENDPEPEPAPVVSGGSAYVEGGDENANERLLEEARRQLSGVTRVAIASPNPLMRNELAARIRDDISGVTVVDSGAQATIHFTGELERFGRGRKRRSAQASIVKGGRVVFRYELPPQFYRVGDTPAEAFARVLSDAFDR